jgi:hypothetical protein
MKSDEEQKKIANKAHQLTANSASQTAKKKKKTGEVQQISWHSSWTAGLATPNPKLEVRASSE